MGEVPGSLCERPKRCPDMSRHVQTLGACNVAISPWFIGDQKYCYSIRILVWPAALQKRKDIQGGPGFVVCHWHLGRVLHCGLLLNPRLSFQVVWTQQATALQRLHQDFLRGWLVEGNPCRAFGRPLKRAVPNRSWTSPCFA